MRLLFPVAVVVVLLQQLQLGETQTTTCDELDVVFVLDSSGSIMSANFILIKQFVERFVDDVEIGPNQALVGVVRFNNVANIAIPLGNHTDSASLTAAIRGLSTVTTETTRTDLGIIKAVEEFNNTARSGSRRVMIVITDGDSDLKSATLAAAADARGTGVTIVAIGIANANRTELEGIASGEGAENTFFATNFDALDQFAQNLVQAACEVAAPVCRLQLDVVFAIPTSEGTSSLLDPMKELVLQTIRNLANIGPNGVQVGVIFFSDQVQAPIRLRQFSNLTSLSNAVMSVRPDRFGSRLSIAQAIETGGAELFGPGSRPGASKTLVVITPRVSDNPMASGPAADSAKKRRIEIIGVGIRSDLDTSELSQIVTEPIDDHLITAPSSLTNLADLAVPLNRTICTAPPCNEKLDAIIIMDESGSIRPDEFGNVVQFVTNVISNFEIGPEKTQIGIVRFSTSVSVPIPLAQFPVKNQLIAAIRSFPNTTSGRTNIHDALTTATAELTSNRSRSDAKRIIVLITDGKATEGGAPEPAADIAKNMGIEIFCFGIGSGINLIELTNIANRPNTTHVFIARNFQPSELMRFVADFALVTCRVPDCSNQVDLVFVLDASGSVGSNFSVVVKLVEDVTNRFLIDDNSAQFGIVTYREVASVNVSLALYTSRSTLIREIKALGNSTGLCIQLCTNTSGGMLLAQQELDGPRHRPEAKKIMILITDGKANVGMIGNELINLARMLRMDNIEIYAVGVADANGTEVRAIASDPKRDHVFLTNNFLELPTFAANLSRASCENIDCMQKVDLVFVVDSSGSIGSDNFRNIVQFLLRVVERFDIGPSTTHIGLVRYSTNAFVRIRLGSYQFKSSILGVIGGLSYETSGLTNIPDAIRLATAELMGPLSRSDAKKLMIVITDGVSNRGGPLDTPSQAAKDAGIEIYVFGIGRSVSESQLETIASEPTSMHVSRPQNFSFMELNQFVPVLAPQVCTNASCVERIDLVFVLDSSSGVTDAEFGVMRSFISMAVTRFNISSTHTMVGVVQYGNTATVTIPIGSQQTVSTLMAAVRSLSSTTTSGTPNIPNAIDTARRHFPPLQPNNNVKRIMVVFANRMSEGTVPDIASIMTAARNAVNTGIEVYAIGTATATVLDAIASDPNSRHVFQAMELTMMGVFAFLEDFATRACTKGGCNRKVDVVFVLDSSGSIGSDFPNVLTFVSEIVSRFVIGENDTQVGIVRFSFNSSVEIELAEFGNKGTLIPAIMGLSSTTGGTTNTAAGIIDGNAQLYGMRGRPDANKVLIVITDGNSNEGGSTITAATDVKNAGAEVVAVGIGRGVNETELNIIASESSRVYRPNSFDVNELARFTDTISNRSCVAPPCGGTQDLVFVLDSSGSIGGNFPNVANFVSQIVNDLMIGPAATQVGVVRYSSTASNVINLAAIPEKVNLINSILNLDSTTGGTTNTAQGIMLGTQMLIGSTRPNARKVLFVITDGRSDNPTDTTNQANAAQSASIEVFAFGIGSGPNIDELNNIASDPDSDHQFRANDFNMATLQQFVNRLSTNLLCPPEQQPCNDVLDVVFILDESGSISFEEFRNMTTFIGNVVNNYNIDPNRIRVGVVRFGTTASLPIQLGQFSTKQTLIRELILLDPTTGGLTNTDLGLQLAQNELSGPRSRAGVAKVAILLTDGASSNSAATRTAATNIRNRGINVFAIGIGPDVNVMELNDIATDLDSEHVFRPTSFSLDELNQLTNILSNLTCLAAGLCSTRIDMAIVLDSSTRPAMDFSNIINFTNALINNFDVSPAATQVSVVQFSSAVTVPITLATHSSKGPLIQAISGLGQTGSNANTAGAISAATTQLTGSSRSNTKPVMVLVLGTSGAVAGSLTIEEAARIAKNEGIEIFAVGTNNVAGTLQTVATDAAHVFNIMSFTAEALSGTIGRITNAACSRSTIPPPPSFCLGQWSQCEPDCHTGVRTRRVVCCDINTRMELPMERCDTPMPPTQERCRGRGPCFDQPQWVPLPWSECTRTCGTGNRVRAIICQIPSTGVTVPNSRCEDPPQPRPRSFEECNHQLCCTGNAVPAFCRLISRESSLCSWPLYRDQLCCWTCGAGGA